MKRYRIKLRKCHEPLMNDYIKHMEDVGGLKMTSIYNRDYHMRLFLEWLGKHGVVNCRKIEPHHIMKYLKAASKKYKPATMAQAGGNIRAFGLYLKMKGIGNPRLADSVPRMRAYHRQHVPSYLTLEQEKKYLQSFNRKTNHGKRDYAIGMVLIKMGLRVREVAALTLEDIDWKNAILFIRHGKNRQVDRLPLLAEVGEAIVDYIRYARPKSEHREIFLKWKYDTGRPMCSGTISSGTRPRLAQFGLNLPGQGAHIMRRTVASRMVQNGASIKQIADVLRHRNINSSMVYTKINIPLLRQVAMPWPITEGGAR